MKSDEKRNREIVRLRLEDPKKWSYTKLGDKYDGLHKTTVEEIFQRDLVKYATLREIKEYQEKTGYKIFALT